MREIKFRAWDKKYKKLYYGGDIKIALACPSEEIEYEQFTGLKDKTGREIYEGDIVYNGDMFGCQTSWGDAVDNFPDKRIVVWKEDLALFSWRYVEDSIKDRGCSGYSLCKSGEKLFEVIGNLHENPYLLEKQS